MNARIPPPALWGNVNVPEPLKAVPFLPYYTELRAGHSGKLDKKPFVRSNRFAPTGPNHQNARLPFDEAYQLRQAGASAGVGIIFDSSHDLVGIDLDNCVDGNGQWSQYAIDAYNWLGRPAWETSISGRGLHFYGRADKSRCPDTTDWVDGSGQHVEIFTKSKFIALSDAFTAQLAGGTLNGPLPDLTDHLIQWAASGGRGVSTGGGKRLPLGHADLAAPSFEWATRTLFDIDPNELTYDEWVTATAAFKAAAWPHKGEDATRATWEVWCAQYTTGRGNDLSQNAAKWRSINEAEAGFNHLLRKSGLRREYQESRALQTFASHPIPAIQTVVSVPQPLDGYVEIISTATGDSGKNTLMETVKLLHGNLPVAFDEFTQTVQATHPLAWDKYSNYPRQWTELDTIHCQLSVQACFVKPGKDTVHDAVAIIANRHKFHPVRDYLNSLTWDGTERLPQLASAYFGASDTPYTRIVGTKFMIGAVARIVLPGCKMDNVVILEGKQGTGKSSAIATLAGARWFTDELPDLHTKDAAIDDRSRRIISAQTVRRRNNQEIYEPINGHVSRTL
ncbi:MAG: hypothetical protein EOS65_14405 [Mesorhizobium sp.]|uniref:VapE domain-containing protein n=1 Tax=Mesorhizobium sp. TaxID=1871066 RepID=UPI000FE808D0|nr:MAG: hypothetical protein EOS65_14405 [Mesorhizobium sp.]